MEALLRRARRHAPRPALKRNPLLRARRRALILLDFFVRAADTRLKRSEQSVPCFRELPPFKRELAALALDVCAARKAAAHLKKTRRLLASLKRIHARRIAACSSVACIRREESAFFGRARSVLERLTPTARVLRKAGAAWATLPDLDESLPTLVLAGHPNTGKSTLLRRLTGAAPRVAPYPFTTHHLNLGYFTCRRRRVQVVDTPGLLDRPLARRNPAEKRAVLALQALTGLVVWVVDPTEGCGYTLCEQRKLFEEMRRRLKRARFVCVRTKADIATPAQQRAALEAFPESLESGQGEGAALREALFSALAKEGEAGAPAATP